MTKHRFWQAPYLSWFSREFYQSVLGSWRGLGLAYLLFFLAIIWLINLVQINPFLTEIKEDYVLPVVEQMPRLEFDGAEMSTNVETPYVIRVDGEVVAIVDPDADVGAVSGITSDVGLVFTRTGVIVTQDGGVPRETPWVAGIDYLDKERLTAWAGLFESWARALLYPFGLAGSFLFRFVEALVLALVALVIGNTQGRPLTYVQAVRLTVVAVSVAVMVQTFLTVANVSIPAWWFVSFLIVAIYQYFGVTSFEGASEDAVEEAY